MDRWKGQCIDDTANPFRQRMPVVVDALGLIAQADAGKVEADRPKATRGKLWEHLPKQERARGHAMQQQDRFALALFADEDVLTVHDDALTFRFVLFNQPGLSHTGSASIGLAEA